MDQKNRIRELAKETFEYANCDKMNERRKLWSNHNSLIFTKPPIYIRSIPMNETVTDDMLQCTDNYYRSIEKNLLLNRYRMELEEDYIIEQFYPVSATVKRSPEGVYGVSDAMSEKAHSGDAAAFKPSILEEEDIEKIVVADYEIDEASTKETLDKAEDTFDGILDVAMDRQGILSRMWQNDISTTLAKIRGLEQIMWDIYDRPEWLLQLVTIMQQNIIKTIDQTQAAGGYRLVNHQNQAMPYANELTPPSADPKSVNTTDLWGYMAAQEFTTIGPEDFKEFMFDLQKPILEKYALTAYGCCEDLSRKIDIVKTLKNLRRIAVSPFADVESCARQIGSDYIISWRPNPSSAVSRGVDEDFVRADLKKTFDIMDRYGCKFDITLKDVETVSNDKSSIIKWTSIVRDEITKRYGE